jgi:hypothetical protein
MYHFVHAPVLPFIIMIIFIYSQNSVVFSVDFTGEIKREILYICRDAFRPRIGAISAELTATDATFFSGRALTGALKSRMTRFLHYTAHRKIYHLCFFQNPTRYFLNLARENAVIERAKNRLLAIFSPFGNLLVSITGRCVSPL